MDDKTKLWIDNADYETLLRKWRHAPLGDTMFQGENRMTIEVMKLALETLEANRQTHHYCEDTWYSCPKHEEGCANELEGDECICGADKANFQFDYAILALRKAIMEAEKQEPVAWKHDCDAILMNNIELWINACPHCGKPRHSSLCL